MFQFVTVFFISHVKKTSKNWNWCFWTSVVYI